MVVFPEGTQVAPGTTLRYKPGGAILAKRAGVPVVPVAHNAGEFWSATPSSSARRDRRQHRPGDRRQGCQGPPMNGRRRPGSKAEMRRLFPHLYREKAGMPPEAMPRRKTRGTEARSRPVSRIGRQGSPRHREGRWVKKSRLGGTRSSPALRRALHWRLEAGALVRDYRTGGWKATLMVAGVSEHLAEAAWHHPGWSCAGTGCVRLSDAFAARHHRTRFRARAQDRGGRAWQPARDGGALEGTPNADDRFRYIRYDRSGVRAFRCSPRPAASPVQ